MWIHYAVSRVIHYTAERLVSLSSSLSGGGGGGGGRVEVWPGLFVIQICIIYSRKPAHANVQWQPGDGCCTTPPTHARHHYQCPKYSKVSVQRIRNSCYSRDLFHFSHLAHSACLFVLLCYRRMIRRYRLYTFL